MKSDFMPYFCKEIAAANGDQGSWLRPYLTVRATVPEAERARFDHWYETDHLPWAKRAFGARQAWRCWSRGEAAIPITACADSPPSRRHEAVVNSAATTRSSSPISTASGGHASLRVADPWRSSRHCDAAQPSLPSACSLSAFIASASCADNFSYSFATWRSMSRVHESRAFIATRRKRPASRR